MAFTEVFRCKVEDYLRESPKRYPLAFGSGNVLHILCSGAIENGHFDTLLPMSSQAIHLEFHKETIRRFEVLEHNG